MLDDLALRIRRDFPPAPRRAAAGSRSLTARRAVQRTWKSSPALEARAPLMEYGWATTARVAVDVDRPGSRPRNACPPTGVARSSSVEPNPARLMFARAAALGCYLSVLQMPAQLLFQYWAVIGGVDPAIDDRPQIPNVERDIVDFLAELNDRLGVCMRDA